MIRVEFDELTFQDGWYHEGQLFTGTAYENWPDGTLRSEQEFEMGMKAGWGREYGRTGQLLEETPYQNGAAHGLARTFYDDGRLHSEERLENARLVWRKAYDRDGRVIEEVHTDERAGSES